MTLTKLIVHRPIAALVIIMGIVVFGVMALNTMDQESTPDMEMPMMIISTSYSGASPEDVDKLVTSPIEGAIGSLSGLDSITSMSREGSSMIMLQYEYGIDMDGAYIDLKEQLDRAARSLPDSAGDPMVMKMSSTQSASMQLSVRTTGRESFLTYVEDELSPEFEKLSTVASVDISGGTQEYISVELVEESLQLYGLTMSSVANSIATADFNQPSGEIDYGSQTLSLTSSTSYRTVQELQNIPISLGDGNLIRLSDVANVYEATKEASSVSRYNGEETVSMNLTKRQSASAVSLSNQARQVVDTLNRTVSDIEIEIMYDDSETIQESISSVFQTLVLGVIISMFILFIFLGDYKASLIVGSSMPVSLLIAFICMYFMGFTINIITMAAMVLGVGMMVDNSIVVLDSCFKSFDKDTPYTDVAVKGTGLVYLSIVASTITTIVVFLPLANISGMVGQLFRPLGYTIAFALIASLFAAMTLVPLFYTRYKPVERRNAPMAKFLKQTERAYAKLVKKILTKKKTVVVVTIALIAGALYVAGGLNMELMSSTDEGRISISVEMRPGTQMAKADAIALQIEEMVAAHEDVDRYTSRASSGSSSVTVYLSDNRKMDTIDVVEQWRLETKNIVDCDITISSQSSMTGGMSSDDVDVTINGNDLDTLKEFSEEIADLMRAHPNMITVSSTLEDGNPEIQIDVDATKAAAYGLTPAQVASSVNSSLSGIKATTVTRDGQDYEVRVEYPAGKYVTYNDMTEMIITGSTGRSVPLSEIATFTFTNAAQSIRKNDSQYQVTVSGTPITAEKFNVQSDIETQVSMLQLPGGVSLGRSSMMQSMDDAFNSIYMAIAVAVLLVFMVMAIQFESIKYSIMVMLCIPMCLIGSFGLLALTGTTLNMTSLLGFLVLVGTVVNNGILFVDTTNEFRKTMDVKAALVMTARSRLRPILMTTLTTVLSMVPMAVAWGTGAEMMQGLAITVIGGLAASTILTLLLLPTFYLILDGNEEKRKQRQQRKWDKQRERIERQEQKHGAHLTKV